MTTLSVGAAGKEQRIDIYLAAALPEQSRSAWQQRITDGLVLLNGEPTQPKQMLKTDDIIEITEQSELEISDIKLPIIYEDDQLIVINKPHGLLTHRVSPSDTTTSVVQLMASKLPTDDDGSLRPGIVHRLDRDTSGVLVLTKTAESHTAMQKLFAEREVNKTYRAVVEGEFEHETAKIDLPIGRNMARPSLFKVDPNGKPSETLVTRLAANNDQSFLKLSPKTGRTHQLRVHLSHINHPIVGDRLYGRPAQRLMLHAYQLEFSLDGKQYSFTSPLPDGFEP